MKITIRRCTDNGTIWEGEAATIKDALREAREAKADLRGSDLRWSNLSGSDLRWSNLSGSDLSGSDLSGSDLSGSDLRGSDLRGSDLRGSDLSGSNLSGSDLSGSNLSPTEILSASWGDVSDDLCRDLMRLDASAHPDPAAFTRWAKGGPCPYDNLRLQRVAQFTERRECWRAGKPPTIFSLVCRLLAEKKCKWGWDKDGKPVKQAGRAAK